MQNLEITFIKSVTKIKFVILMMLILSLNSVLHAQESQQIQPILAKIYQQEKLEQWWVSEKMDGVRAIWDGKQLSFRSGNKINSPNWFIKHFPKQKMDGELWMGRGTFELLSGTVRKKKPQDHEWKKVRYMLFELPMNSGTFSQRIEQMKNLTQSLKIPWLQMIPQFQVNTEKELMQELDDVVKNGGEGLMLHRADSLYHGGRSNDLLKLKAWQDAEATVLEIIPGKGKFQRMMGALKVKDHEGNIFRIGSGFKLKNRRNPPKIGSIITFKFTGKTSNGIPKFTSFLRVFPK